MHQSNLARFQWKGEKFTTSQSDDLKGIFRRFDSRIKAKINQFLQQKPHREILKLHMVTYIHNFKI